MSLPKNETDQVSNANERDTNDCDSKVWSLTDAQRCELVHCIAMLPNRKKKEQERLCKQRWDNAVQKLKDFASTTLPGSSVATRIVDRSQFAALVREADAVGIVVTQLDPPPDQPITDAGNFVRRWSMDLK